VLGLLKDRPMHGYQLTREVGESLGGFWRVSYGSLYPTLKRLQTDGAITTANPDGRPAGGRKKTVYEITPEGERLFLALLQEAPQEGSSEDARFRVRLAFFRYLPPETRLRLLERRRDLLEDRLSAMDESLRGARDRVDDYTLALMEHGRRATTSDIEWLDGLIQAERSRGVATPGGRRRRSAALHRKENTS
jgi:DNA-binding PadR family transcriptional regulator